MRRNLFYMLLVATMFVAMGCKITTKNSSSKTSIGEPYEVFVICEDNHWDNHIESAAKEALECYVDGLSRPEKCLHIVDHDNSSDVSDLERTHSNILEVRIDPTNSTTKMLEAKNVYSTAQLMVSIHAPSAAEAAQYIRDNAADIRKSFEQNERNIHHMTVTASKSDEAMTILRNATGIDMHIPGGFFVAKPKEDIIKWFIRKYPNKQQHIFAFTDPCEDIESVSLEQLVTNIENHIGIISVQDEEDSFMCISRDKERIVKAVDINGRRWYELRCGWRVEGYTMGGPMVSYTTYDEANKRLVTIAFALFSPEQPQRHDMAQLESLIYLTE